MEFIKLSCKYLVSLILHIFWLFPVRKNRVFIMNDLSHTYGGSPKYVCEYLLANMPGRYEIIYPLKSLDEPVKKGVITVRPKSARHFYYALTSRVIVTNCGGVSYLPIRRSQMVLNTAHGGVAYKKCGLSAYQGLAYRLETRLNAIKTSYLMTSARLMKEEFSEAMLIKKENILESGIPRIDMFFTEYDYIRAGVCRRYGIEKEKRIVMYCPTFRSGENALSDFYRPKLSEMNISVVLKALEKRFGGEWIMAVRMHPRLKKSMLKTGTRFDGEVVDFSEHPDMQELLCAADAVISDYSSLIWDYSFTGKPCFIYADDIEKYRQSPGFYVPIEEWPYPLAGDFQTLLDNIAGFDEEKYRRDRERHYRDLGSYETGTATETACRLIDGFCRTQAD